MAKDILVVGSIGFDIIFSINGDIRDEILVKDGKVAPINMMFTANNKQRYFGGTGGNISFGLGSLGENPLLFSVVGKDFEPDYTNHLLSYNVDLHVKIDPQGFTATFYGISDQAFQQIGIWQPNAYGNYIEKTPLQETIDFPTLQNIKYAIFSPGTAISTLNHIIELRKIVGQKTTVIFDPSQALTVSYNETILKECFTHSNILIGNDTEIGQIKRLFKFSFEKIFDLGVDTIIETVGADGVNVYKRDGESFHVDAEPVEKVVETTGAGDAFRAGLLYGLNNDLTLRDACKIGNWLAGKSVSEMSGQLYRVDMGEFKRFLSSFIY